jgi:hypothetical protein
MAHLHEAPRPTAVERDRGAATVTQGEDAAAPALASLRLNLEINRSFRILVGTFGLVAGALALLYTWRRGDRMVELLVQDRLDLERLLVLGLPVLTFGLFAGLAVAVCWGLHSRGQEELLRTLDTVSRIRREGEVAVSARGLMFSFEEKLVNARRAFMLLLWFGRTLFIVCLGLFTISAGRAILGETDLFTVALSATSVAGALLAIATDAPRKVKEHLADVVQVQSIVTGCDRQISLLESDAQAVMNSKLCTAEKHRMVLEVQGRMGLVTRRSAQLVEHYAEPSPEEP